MTARLDAFTPMRETRAYGLGGQFQKGGGHIPGRSVPVGAHAGDDEPPQLVPVEVGAGAVEVDKDTIREMRREITNGSYWDGSDAAAFNDADDGKGAFADNEVWVARHAYTSSQYKTINTAARTGDLGQTHEALDRGFTPPPARHLPGPVYRGVDEDNFGPMLSVGERFIDHGYTSTSASGGTATNFAGVLGGSSPVHRTVYRIAPTIETLTTRTVMPGNRSESEWVLPRGSTFTVRKITQYTNPEGGVHRIIDLDWDGVEA